LAITEGPGTKRYQYLFTDALGSLDAAVDPTQLNAIERYSFDAWGNRRRAEIANAGNLWTGYSASEVAALFGTPTSTTRKGFTGHEMLDQAGLIHMRARLYDPLLGRFIQADSMVEDDATQGLNRYSYCLNNPLSRTDPTGNLSFRQVLGAAVGIAASILSFGAATPLTSFLWAVGGGFAAAFIATGSLKAGLWGAASAAVFWGIGNHFSNVAADSALASSAETFSSFMDTGLSGGQFAAQVAAHAAAGGTLNMLQGGKFGHGFISAGVTKALTPAIESLDDESITGLATAATVSALLGGTASSISGEAFSNGAATAAFQYLFNARGTRNRRASQPTREYSSDQIQLLRNELAAIAPGWRAIEFIGPSSAAGNQVQIRTLQREIQLARQEMARRAALGIGTRINEVNQSRHLLGSPNYNNGGYFINLNQAQAVLNGFHSGAGTVIGAVPARGQIFFKFSGAQGFNNNPGAGYLNQPTNTFMIKGTSRVSVSPVSPSWRPK
jgi:RHS repeat-associated protein